MNKLKNIILYHKVTASSDTLSQRAFISGFWLGALKIVQQLFSLGRLVILARVLTPHDFGLVGIALLLLSTLDTFSQTGFEQALVQKNTDIRDYLDSAWTILILRGMIIFLLLYFTAPYTSIFFNSPESKLIIQVIGISVLIQAFNNIGIVYFQKELEFNRHFIYQLSGTLTDFFVAIIAVYILGNVWALVYGLLAGNMAMLVTSYFIHPYRPRFHFDIIKVKELLNYGKWVLGSSILIFFVTQGDDILVGKVLTVTALGFYQLAYKISNLPATQITHLISKITFPVYSKMQENLVKLSATYIQILKLTSFISCLVTVLIFSLADEFIVLFLGEKWMPMVSVIQILVLSGLVRSVQATTGPVFYALNKTRVDTKVQSIRFVVIAIFIYPFMLKWGLNGASLAVLMSILFACMVAILMLVKTLVLSSKEILYSLIYPLISGIISTISMHCLKLMVSTSILEFVGMIFFGIFIYISVSLFFQKYCGYDAIRTIKKMLVMFD